MGIEDVKLICYYPSVSSITTTVRYNHSLALAETKARTLLLTNEDPPDSISTAFDDHHIIESTRPLGRAREAKCIVDSHGEGDCVYVTTFHYEAALSGFLSAYPWILDVYDAPRQYALNAPWSHHSVTTRVLERLLNRADRALHTYSLESPDKFSPEPRQILEGFPVEAFSPGERLTGDTLHGVWVGKPRMDRGMSVFLEGMSRLEDPGLKVDVYGEPHKSAQQRAQALGLGEFVTFKGSKPHTEIQTDLASADLGFCILPSRRDWQYATPVKVREYMAAAAVPVLSAFPGMRLLAEGVGLYTEPTPESIAATLRRIGSLKNHELQEKMDRARSVAEGRPLADQRTWFARQVLEPVVGIDPF